MSMMERVLTHLAVAAVTIAAFASVVLTIQHIIIHS